MITLTLQGWGYFQQGSPAPATVRSDRTKDTNCAQAWSCSHVLQAGDVFVLRPEDEEAGYLHCARSDPPQRFGLPALPQTQDRVVLVFRSLLLHRRYRKLWPHHIYLTDEERRRVAARQPLR